jgi:flagellar basal-body rod protein FlgB
MFQSLDIFKTAMSMARHAGQAQALSAQNMANADTPGYRAMEMPDFAESLRQPLTGQRATRDGHLNGTRMAAVDPVPRRMAQDPNGNTVSLEREMLMSVAADRQHNRALTVYRHSLTLLRASLGRN